MVLLKESSITIAVMILMAVMALVGCSDDLFTDAETADASAEIAGASAETADVRGGGHQFLGDAIDLGNGSVTAFANILPNGKPQLIGVKISDGAHQNLPPGPNDARGCWDLNGDTVIDQHMECLPGYEYILYLPSEIQSLADTPFQYVMFNWNPAGHVPPGVYDLPHFDLHFYMQDFEEVEAMVVGPCPGTMDCNVFATATKTVPPQYVPEDYIDVQATEARMGNHLIDPTSPEFNGETFTRTFIFGAYDGEITFYEPMITRAYLLSKAKECRSLKLPQAWEVAGYYPTEYCTDYKHGEHVITLEKFRYRHAS